MSFKSWRSYWDFSQSVNTKFRYIMSPESKDFLTAIDNTCQKRALTLPKGTSVWRAQEGHGVRPFYQTDPDTDEEIHIEDWPCPYDSSRMKPLPFSASEGRANSKGIPCLYVATDKETAMSEIRPWLGSIISLGHFKLSRDLRIIDFSVNHGKTNKKFYFKEPSASKIIETVWLDIDNAFSKPTKTSDLKSDYTPTQIISEFIKSKGYDGIAYKSSLADGHNIALFDLDSAEVVERAIFEPSKVRFDFEQVQED